MEQLTAFLATQEGKIICFVFIAIGITDFFIAKFYLGRMLEKTESELSPSMSPVQSQPISDRIKSLKTIIMLIKSSGVLFIMFGIFGLTR